MMDLINGLHSLKYSSRNFMFLINYGWSMVMVMNYGMCASLDVVFLCWLVVLFPTLVLFLFVVVAVTMG